MSSPFRSVFPVVAMVLLVGAGAGLAQWNGEIVAWGDNSDDQCEVPSPNEGFIAIAAGGWHSLGLKEDGSIVGWGGNDWGQTTAPSGNSGFIAVAAGEAHSLALTVNGAPIFPSCVG